MFRQRGEGNSPLIVKQLLLLRLLLCTTLELSTAAHSRFQALPLARQFADDLTAAADRHDHLNASLTKLQTNQESLEWFVATAAKQMVDLNSVTLNASASGSLANQFQTCWDSTSAPLPPSVREKDLWETAKDSDLTLKVVHAHLFEVYQNEVRIKRLGSELEECEQDCKLPGNSSNNSSNSSNGTNINCSDSSSVGDAEVIVQDQSMAPQEGVALLAKARKQLRGVKKKAPGLFDTIPIPMFKVHPELKPISDAMVHTRQRSQTLSQNISQQEAVNSVLEDAAVKAMKRYPGTLKTIEHVQNALKECLDVEAATQLSANASAELLNATLSGIPAKNATNDTAKSGNATAECNATASANKSGNGSAAGNSSCNGTANATSEEPEDPLQFGRLEAMRAAEEQAQNATAQLDKALANLRACRRKCNSGDHMGDKMEELARRLARAQEHHQHQAVYDRVSR